MIDYSEAYLIGMFAFPRLNNKYSVLQCIEHGDAILKGFKELYERFYRENEAHLWEELLENPIQGLTTSYLLSSWDEALSDYVEYYLTQQGC